MQRKGKKVQELYFLFDSLYTKIGTTMSDKWPFDVSTNLTHQVANTKTLTDFHVSLAVTKDR